MVSPPIGSHRPTRRPPPSKRCEAEAGPLRRIHSPNVSQFAGTRRGFNGLPPTAAIAVAVFIAVLAIPVKQRCGAPGLSCASAVDPQGNVHYYDEVEPVGVYLAEIVTGSNIRWYYTSGEDLVKAQ
jgi:hypothetical protein